MFGKGRVQDQAPAFRQQAFLEKSGWTAERIAQLRDLLYDYPAYADQIAGLAYRPGPARERAEILRDFALTGHVPWQRFLPPSAAADAALHKALGREAGSYLSQRDLDRVGQLSTSDSALTAKGLSSAEIVDVRHYLRESGHDSTDTGGPQLWVGWDGHPRSPEDHILHQRAEAIEAAVQAPITYATLRSGFGASHEAAKAAGQMANAVESLAGTAAQAGAQRAQNQAVPRNPAARDVPGSEPGPERPGPAPGRAGTAGPGVPGGDAPAERAAAVEAAMRANPRNTIGAGGEASALATLRARGPAANLNDFRTNFDTLDLSAPEGFSSVKTRGVDQPLSASILNKYEKDLKTLTTSPMSGTVPCPVEKAATRLDAIRAQLVGQQAWPTALRPDANIPEIVRFINQESFLKIPADHVAPLRNYIRDAATRNPDVFELSAGRDLPRQIDQLLSRIQSSGMTSNEISVINRRVHGHPAH